MTSLLKKIQALRIEDYAYELPDERIAKFPVEPRDSSKLLLYQKGQISEKSFRNLPEYLTEGSLLVYNNTRVIHARLFFFKESGARIEVFCLEPLDPADYAQNFQSAQSCEWLCLVGNLKKWKEGVLVRHLSVGGRPVVLTAEKTGREDKALRIRFCWQAESKDGSEIRFGDLLEEAGQLPIPPYLNRETRPSDEQTYQTVYSRIEGSVAAPTAGLHFTDEVMRQIDAKNILRREVTLHVGAGTFQPVLSEQMLGHTMHSEFISVERSLLCDLLSHLGNITAVGTTSVRTLESLYWFGYRMLTHPDGMPDEWTLDQWYAYGRMSEWEQEKMVPPVSTEEALNAILNYLDQNQLEAFTASTRLLIAPGYHFHVVNAMLTNFHQPNSTLLLLVSAFLGEDSEKGSEAPWRRVYRYAMDNGFRFLSYGDSSLLIP